MTHSAHEPWHRSLPEGFADHLALESRLSASLRSATLDRAQAALDAPPSRIVDLGSGVGADAVALAERFPTARVHALDVSDELLARVRSAATTAQVADRVESHRVDLNDDWPATIPPDADLVWAALSLHHLDDPAKALRRAYSVLRPGGVLVLTELAGEPRFAPDDLGSGLTALHDRMRAARAAHGYARADWPDLLAAAGFAQPEQHELELIVDASTGDGAQYLEYRLRAHGEGEVTGDDQAVLEDIIASLRAGTSPISHRSARAVWIAVRPRAEAVSSGRGDISADVAVVGGSFAGLAAAIVLARSRRDVVVIDEGRPRNSRAEGAHNVLGHEGIAPRELLAKGRAEAESYGVRIIAGSVTGLSGAVDDFTVQTGDDGPRIRARRIILATGLVDDLPEIPGVVEAWGKTVLHCPFCHGWEVRDRRIAVLSRAEPGIHQALLFRRLSDQVTLFLHEASELTEEQSETLAALEIPVVRGHVDRLVVDGTDVRAVQTEDGQSFDTDAVVVAPRFLARTDLYESIGGVAEVNPFGTQIPADPRGMTPVPGIWVAGNAGQPMAMVVASSASGVATGAAVHGDLVLADADRAVRDRRSVAA
ncbi:thioredoxin reductase (NADPH) [Microbacterium sp. W4I4]|uniref:FAD-dependent oxidoreductase n=1 Tax=Microbacterium sp. W4I4 TaxID=3042295 RepID=UPI00278AE728|nr:FAD-dependent oxidoreductase [Microbacterium sp. W4I4]MDQ0613423.1 thioredoxin reductase (NADPH) [Microbacterium sp. W4I4]